MLQEQIQIVQKLFKRHNVEWYINITKTSSKDIEFAPLYDELSFDSSDDIKTSITLIKNFKKSVYSFDGFSLESCEKAFIQNLELIDLWEFDEDIIVCEINDNASADFTNKQIELVDFEYLKKQFLNLKEFNFKSNISLDTFSAWTQCSTHYYINSNWSIKSQSDNSCYYYFELFWEWEQNQDVEWCYKVLKLPFVIDQKEIEEIQNKVIDKITPTKSSLNPWVYNVTLDRELVVEFLDIILSSLWAEAIRLWLSMFSKNNIWDKIFGDNFTLVNNPNLPWFVGNMLFDSEWITAKKTTIFSQWILKSKFYKYKDLLKEWMDFIWNSSISNIELIWATSKDYLSESNVLFTSLMAMHSIDTITWKYSLSWEWYLIENWKKTDYIKDISLTWNIIDLFKNILCIWDDFFDYGNYKVPSITFANQKVV